MFKKLRIWLIMFICPKDTTVVINARDKHLNRTIHIWAKHPVHFIKCSVSAPIVVHPPKVKSGFKEYIAAERFYEQRRWLKERLKII